MLKSGAWPVPLLLLLLLAPGAGDAQVLPEPRAGTTLDPLTPVPPPFSLLGSPGNFELVMPKELTINNQGGTIEGNIKTGVHFGGPVQVRGDNGLEVFSTTALLDLQAKSVTFEGKVSVYQGNTLQRGERAVYYYERKFLDATGLRASLDPILLESGKFTSEQRGNKQVYVGKDGGITTDDVSKPAFWARANTTTIYPEDRVVFNNLWLYAKDTPVFWLPYLSQPLNPELGYHFLPGARSTWGGYLLNTYGVMLGGDTDPRTGENKDAWLLSRWHLDLRTTRGLATGLDLVDTRLDNRQEISGLSLSYLYDLAPETSTTGFPRETTDPNRYEVKFKYRITPQVEQDAAWRVDSNITLLSDPYYLQDFAREEYQTNPTPDNTLGIYRRDDRSLTSLYARFQVNDFYRTDTRLPQLSYDRVRAPLFGLPVLHEGNASLGLIGQQAIDGTRSSIINPLMELDTSPANALKVASLLSQLSGYELQLAQNLVALPPLDPRRKAIQTQLADSSYGRFNTYQVLSLPMMFGGCLSFTPEAGVGYSRYFAVAGPEGDSNRTQLHVGAETALKFAKNYGSYQNHDWGLNGILHVCQPYTTWSVLSANNLALEDPMVDRLTPTTRPQPLDPVRFTATDELRSWNVLRCGVRNNLITKRDDQNFTWLYLDTYVNAFIQAPDDAQAFSNMYNDVQWQPVPWMAVGLATQFPLANNQANYNEFNSYMRFIPTDYFSFALGSHRLSGQPLLPNTNSFSLQTYTRLSENWGFGTRHSVELDDSTVEFQQYSIHRDLGSWVAALGVTIRDNRIQQEYGLIFSLTLKEFPSASLPFKINAP